MHAIIFQSGPRLNTKTTSLLILLSVVEGTLQYGSLILTITLIYILVSRWRSLSQLLYVHNVTVSSPLPYQQAIITSAVDQRNNNIYSQLWAKGWQNIHRNILYTWQRGFSALYIDTDGQGFYFRSEVVFWLYFTEGGKKIFCKIKIWTYRCKNLWTNVKRI